MDSPDRRRIKWWILLLAAFVLALCILQSLFVLCFVVNIGLVETVQVFARGTTWYALASLIAVLATSVLVTSPSTVDTLATMDFWDQDEID